MQEQKKILVQHEKLFKENKDLFRKKMNENRKNIELKNEKLRERSKEIRERSEEVRRRTEETKKTSLETRKRTDGTDAILNDLVADNLIADKNNLTFKLNSDKFILNGITQPDAIHQKYKEKYMADKKGSIVFDRKTK